MFDYYSYPVVTYLENVVVTGSGVYFIEDPDTSYGTVDAVITGAFVEGNNGLAFSGGFQMNRTGSPSDWRIGGFVFEQDDFLTGAERNSGFAQFGMLATGSVDPAELSGVFGGPAYDNVPGMPDDPVLAARSFDPATFLDPFEARATAPGADSIFRSNNVGDEIASTGFQVVDDTLLGGQVSWGAWIGDHLAGDGEIFKQYGHNPNGGELFEEKGHRAYWFIADPTDLSNLPVTGNLRFENLLEIQGGSHQVITLLDVFADIDQMAANDFSLDIDFSMSTGAVTNGEFRVYTDDMKRWDVNFAGNLVDQFVDLTVTGGTLFDVSATPVDEGGTFSGILGGYFVGASAVDGLALSFSVLAQDTGVGNVDRHLSGTALIDGATCVPGTDCSDDLLVAPDDTLSAHDISWGQWDNPVEENWVTVVQNDSSVQLQAGDFVADVIPTPVANMTGSARYETGIASGFIGNGSAGAVSQVVAGMNVDFDNGAITDGSLQVQAGDQAWQLGFGGSVANGQVDLNSLGGTLANPGGIISTQIDAELGGVFTGHGAEAFVGGFDMIDATNPLNNVEGLYTIER